MRTALSARTSLALAAICLLAGCTRPFGQPKQIETGVPGETYYTSIAAPSPIATVTYEEPATDSPSAAIEPRQEWSEAKVAADALGRIGAPAVPSLVEALKSDDPEARMRAAQVLARMGTDAKDAVPALVQALEDPDESVRKEAARALGRVGPDAAPAVPALMRSLLAPEPLPPTGELKPVPNE